MIPASTRAREIFTVAVEQYTPDEWSNYLDTACGDDSELRRRVNLLLEAHVGEESILNNPAVGCPTVELSHIAEKPGTQIGPYKLLQQLGEGGMGVVYMAEQKEPIKRRVALKIIKPGMDTRQVVTRFEAERQALAMMDHPNIAKVLDAGQTESGRPYFVMELVKGMPVTNYCDEQHLTPRERLELFVAICQGVQHAHQKGIIHRDLKPSNILVALYDGKAVPKIIDFGVAKATSQTLTEKTMFTQVGQVIGTLEYMSPEQAEINQLDVDTRSDIYSLGVVLYELLTGETPFDRQRLRSAAFDEMLRIIREEEPSKPSTKLSSSQSLPSIAANRKIEPARLSTLVRGELDWIVMKALEKDRSRRYETASKFAEDIQYHLNGEQVIACPPSVGYKFRKFARRNRVVLTTVTAVAAVLVLATVVSAWQAVRATRAAIAERKASRAAIASQEKEAEQRRAADEARTAAENALIIAEQEYQRAEKALTLVTAEQQRAEANLDLALKAMDAVYLEAIGEQKLLSAGRPELNPKHPFDNIAYEELTPLERTLLDKGLRFYTQFAASNQSTSNAAAASSAEAFYRVALLQGAIEQGETAESNYREAIRRYKLLVEKESQNATHLFRLSKVYLALAANQQNFDKAVELYDASQDAITRAIAINDNQADYFQHSARTRRANGHFLQALADQEKAVALAPDNLNILLEAASAYINSGTFNNKKRALELCERALKVIPQSAEVYTRMGEVFYYLNSDQSLYHFAEALKIRNDYAPAYNGRARVFQALGEHEKSLADANEAVRLSPRNGGYYIRRGTSLLQLNRLADARLDFDMALQLIPPSAPNYIGVLTSSANCYLQMGDAVRAEGELTRAIRQAPMLHFPYGDRLAVRLGLHKYDAALEDFRSVVQLFPESRYLTDTQLKSSDEDFQQGVLDILAELIDNSETAEKAKFFYAMKLHRYLLALGRRSEAKSVVVSSMKREQVNLKLKESELGLVHPEVLKTMDRLAYLSKEAGEHSEALALYEALLKRRQAEIGSDHLETIDTMHSLACEYTSVGKPDQALPLFQESLRLRRAKLGPDNLDTLSSMTWLAYAYKTCGKTDQALSLYEETLNRRKAKLGVYHQDTHNALFALLDVYLKDGGTADGRELFEEFRQHLPKDSLPMAKLLAVFGAIQLERKSYTEAETLLSESVSIRDKLLPGNILSTNAHLLLGRALLAQQKYADAEQHLLGVYQSLNKLNQTMPLLDSQFLPVLDVLIELYTATNRTNEAEKYRALRAMYPINPPTPRSVP